MTSRGLTADWRYLEDTFIEAKSGISPANGIVLCFRVSSRAPWEIFSIVL